jgi:hypothetical protein
MIEITLTPQQMMTAGNIGLRRHVAAIARRLQHHNSLPSADDFDCHILGAMAEYVAAKVFNLFWDDHIGIINGRDVGGVVEVRCRRPASGLDLAIRPDDDDEHRYLLVHAEVPAFRLIGWTTAGEGKRIGQWNERARVYFVPVAALTAPEELFAITDSERGDYRAHLNGAQVAQC